MPPAMVLRWEEDSPPQAAHTLRYNIPPSTRTISNPHTLNHTHRVPPWAPSRHAPPPTPRGPSALDAAPAAVIWHCWLHAVSCGALVLALALSSRDTTAYSLRQAAYADKYIEFFKPFFF